MDGKKEMDRVMRMLVGDFNENHDPDTGRFVEGGSGGSGGSGQVKYASYSDFPKTVTYEGEEYYNEGSKGHMSTSSGGKAQSYVRWDDNNDEQYISVNERGEIERE